MSESTCFFGELLMSPFGSYTHGETVFEEFTTVDQCTRNIAGHLQMLHLRESTELKSESDLILMRAGKSIFIITLFEEGGAARRYRTRW